MGLLKRVKESYNDGVTGNTKRYIADIKLTCTHCGGDDFDWECYQLNTRGFTFLGIDFLNKEANVYRCQHCGHLEWFV